MTLKFRHVHNYVCMFTNELKGAPGLMERLYAGSRWRHMPKRFFRSNRPEYLQYPSMLRAGKMWYQSGGRWLQCHRTSAVVSALSNRQNRTCARKIEFTLSRCTAPAVRGQGSVLLSHSRNVVTKIGVQQHKDCKCTSPSTGTYPVP